jgi:hypothetical protein
MAKEGEVTGVAQVAVQLLRLNLRPDERVRIEREPNDTPEDANPMEIGKTVYGTGDDVDYLYNTDEGKNGWDWFTFEWKGEPKLVFFEVDLLDRDIITTLKLYKQETTPDGKTKLVEYTQGKDPTEVRHDDQGDELLAWKFITRILTPGRYYLAVRPNHPVYALRTAVYDVPPYLKPDEVGKADPQRWHKPPAKPSLSPCATWWTAATVSSTTRPARRHPRSGGKSDRRDGTVLDLPPWALHDVQRPQRRQKRLPHCQPQPVQVDDGQTLQRHGALLRARRGVLDAL